MKAAVIGLGIGHGHCAGYLQSPHAELSAVCDLMPDRLARVGGTFEQGSMSELRQLYPPELLGKSWEESYAHLNVDESKNIQNVGQRMRDMGYPITGAIMQGGVNYANSMANKIWMAPFKDVTKKLEEMSKVYSLFAQGKEYYETGEQLFQSGATLIEFAAAYGNRAEDYDRYLNAVTAMTETGLKTTAMGADMKQKASAKDAP